MPNTQSKTHKRYGVTLTWEESISKQLVGRKIVEVRWMTKEEALWLADKFYDIYYALNVDEMYEKDQNIFRSIERKLSEIK